MSTFVRDAHLADVKKLLGQLAEVLSKYSDLDELRTQPAIDKFRDAIGQLEVESRRYLDHYRLAVVGDFKVGKSSIINALVAHEDLVAEGVAPTTGAVTELMWGDSLSGQVLDEEGTLPAKCPCSRGTQ